MLAASMAVNVYTSPTPNRPFSCSGTFFSFFLAERPYLVDLEVVAPKVVHRAVLVFLTGLADIDEELGDGVLGCASHADGAADRVAFD